MQPTEDNNRLRALRFIVQVMFLVGFVIVAIPFFSSTGDNIKALPVLDVPVADMREGDSRYVVWNNWPVFILKRSAGMLADLQVPNDNLLDPRSIHSQQPASAKNSYRSVTPGFFVSYLGCGDANYPVKYDPAIRHLDNKHGVLVCWGDSGSMYDLAGRVYTGMPDKQNLAVPLYSFPEDGILRLGEE